MGNPDSNSTIDSREKEESAPPRESLINHALTFLLDKKIRDQDPSLLRRFLMKKGLREEEVTIVFQRFEDIKNKNALENVAMSSQLVPSQRFLGPPLPPPPSSLWVTVHRVVTTITSIGGIVYAIYWLWKTYISPYLFGRRPKRKPVDESLAELGAAVSSCAADLRTLRSGVDALTADRAAEMVVNTRLQEIKSEVTSLKSLLLNRNQFPATPSTGPLSIPAWQLAAETHSRAEGEEEGEGEGSNGGTNGSDSSLEIVKLTLFV
ncbi:peroxisomal membrane protein PEX14 [Macrosteles quadrilineatus]|uniref:peroxisomal membrane protein PEX14 n=1 Tax=Macrosteles quadrilineatus TaxID=74068 RepID=UPI0023E20FFF|nr:peroxisomal membrane protein PEX14 [Macrosteles quadrilineatus]